MIQNLIGFKLFDFYTLKNLLVTKIKKLDDGYVAQNEIQFRI